MNVRRGLFRLWAVAATIWVVGVLAAGIAVESDRPRARYLTDDEFFGQPSDVVAPTEGQSPSADLTPPGSADAPRDFSAEGTPVLDTTGLTQIDAAAWPDPEMIAAWAAWGLLPPLGILVLGAGVAAIKPRIPTGAKSAILPLSLFLGYFVVAGLTSAYQLDDDPECARKHRLFRDQRTSSDVSALLWPIYWPVHIGEELHGRYPECLLP